MATISELQTQIQAYETQKDEINAKEPLDTDALNLVNNKLSELNYELEQLQAAEQSKQEKVAAATQENNQAVDELMLDSETSLRDVLTDETTYQFVSIAIKSLLQSNSTKYINQISEQEVKVSDLQKQIDALNTSNKDLEKQADALAAENAELTQKVNQLTLERDDAYKVRDNAAREIESYKQQLSASSTGTTVVDQSEQLKQAKEAWMNSRIKVTNIRWTDEIAKKEYSAELVLDGEQGKSGDTITFNRLEKGKYLEVTAEEAARFRAEAQQATATAETSATESTTSTVSDSTLVTTETEVQPVESVPTFQTEAKPVAGLDTSNTAEVAEPATITKAEWEALKADVEELKSRVMA